MDHFYLERERERMHVIVCVEKDKGKIKKIIIIPLLLRPGIPLADIISTSRAAFSLL